MPTNNTGEFITLNRVVDKLETLVEKLYVLEKTITQDMVVLKDNLRQEITSLERRVDQNEIEIGRLKMIAGAATVVATLSVGALVTIAMTNLFRTQSVQAESLKPSKPAPKLEAAR